MSTASLAGLPTATRVRGLTRAQTRLAVVVVALIATEPDRGVLADVGRSCGFETTPVASVLK